MTVSYCCYDEMTYLRQSGKIYSEESPFSKRA